MHSSGTLAVLALVVVTLMVPGECQQRISHYSRAYWNANAAKKPLQPFTTVATKVVLASAETESCTYGVCADVVKKMQIADMENGFDDIGYNFVVGGCTGVFEGAGWDKIAPFAEDKEQMPSINLAVVGTYTPNNHVQSAVAGAVKSLIQEGIKKGRISPDYVLICQPAMLIDDCKRPTQVRINRSA